MAKKVVFPKTVKSGCVSVTFYLQDRTKGETYTVA